MIKLGLVRKITLLTVILIIPFFNLIGQTDTIKISRKNIIKINLISLPPLFNNLSQKWIGLEYQRIINEKLSLSLLTDFGIFQDYRFTKYHDFFDENGGFSYTQEDVFIPGYHIIPSINYYFIRSKTKAAQGIYVAGKFDYYHYFMKTDIYHSSTNQTESYKNSTYRFNIGCGLGAQYVVYERFTLDLNVSLFTKLFSKSTSEEVPELYPENSFWRSSDNSSWATVNLMLGYAFGSGKNRKSKK